MIHCFVLQWTQFVGQRHFNKVEWLTFAAVYKSPDISVSKKPFVNQSTQL